MQRIAGMLHMSCRGNPLHTLHMLWLLVTQGKIHLDAGENKHNWTWSEEGKQLDSQKNGT